MYYNRLNTYAVRIDIKQQSYCDNGLLELRYLNTGRIVKTEIHDKNEYKVASFRKIQLIPPAGKSAMRVIARVVVFSAIKPAM